MDPSIIQKITIYAIPLIFAITFHEAAHAYAAKYFGDSTAYMLGRMTLNPLKHIDPVWTIAIPLVLMLTGAPVFGAAKAVPVNFGALRNPKRDMVWVAAAGPAANLVMMLVWAIVARVLMNLPETVALEFFISMSIAGMGTNAVLMVLNLFPMLPLDGGRIVTGLLPGRWAYQYSRLEPYGMIILVILMLTHIIEAWIWPLVNMSLFAVYSLVGLPI